MGCMFFPLIRVTVLVVSTVLGLVELFEVVVGLLVLAFCRGITAMQKYGNDITIFFQNLRVPLSSMFLLFVCLHDLPMLWFAISRVWHVGVLVN